MGKRHTALDDDHIAFIAQQRMFFVATATADSRVNVSPKGMDTLRVLGRNRVLWLNVTGSGNETSAHVQLDPRMTLMFCAFEGDALILRLYGKARVVHRSDADWDTLYAQFEPLPGARQLFDMTVDLVQTSCGFGVPLFRYEGQRDFLNDWAMRKGEAGIEQYWREKNQFSIDQLPTHIVERNR